MQHTKMNFKTLLFALLIAGLSVTGCKKDKNTAQENITRVVAHVIGTGTSTFDQEFTWEDKDGDGGNAPTIQGIFIPSSAGTEFNVQMHVYDDTKTPVEDLTEEIEKENKVHLFTYAATNGVFTIGNFNLDDDGKTFGLKSTWTKGSTGSGTVNIVLHHEPTNKGDLNNPGGETDFDVTFAVTIQ